MHSPQLKTRSLAVIAGCHKLGLGASAFAILLAMTFSGCQHIGPTAIVTDRVAYNESVASTWKEQTLLNIVRMRYADTTSFTDVSQIVNSYVMNRSAGIDAAVVPGAAAGIPTGDRIRSLVNLNARHSDRPTVTYTPQYGSDFTRRLAAPIRPEVILFLIEAGYPTDVVFDLTVQSINGLNNRSTGLAGYKPPDPEFTWVVDTFHRAQMSRSVSARVKLEKEAGEVYLLGIRSSDPDLQLEEDLRHAKELLGLDPNLREFRVIDGVFPKSPNDIAIKTRPLLLVLRDLAPYVEVPLEHATDGSAVAADATGDSAEFPLQIRSSKCKPEDCFVAAQYRGYWFWIDNRHFASKRTFFYLMVLLAQSERTSGERLPLVTIQAN